MFRAFRGLRRATHQCVAAFPRDVGTGRRLLGGGGGEGAHCGSTGCDFTGTRRLCGRPRGLSSRIRHPCFSTSKEADEKVRV
jgi:hypothetical protein